MSNVFLAYKRADGMEYAKMVRAKLDALSVPLFIDHKQGPGENYINVINDELDSALAVLVLWTKGAVERSETSFVQSEAQRGYTRRILIAATFDKSIIERLPVPFNLVQACDLSDWAQSGAAATHPEFQKLLEALGKKLGRPGLPDLAIALESESDALKRKFLKDYPADPAAQKIAVNLEAFERAEFAAQLAAAQRRVQQRAKDAEKRLKLCRDEFETQIAELRAGRDYMPPDPSKAIGDRVAALSTQIEIHEGTIASERARAEQAEASAAGANAEVVALKGQLGKLDAGTALLDARNVAIEQLNSDLAKRDAQIVSHESTVASQATELAALAEAVANTRQASEAKDARIGELADAVTSHKRRQQTEKQRLTLWSGVAALFAACVFTAVGWSMAPSGPTQPSATVQTLNAQIANLSAQNKTLQTQADAAQRQASDATDKNKSVSSQVAVLNSQIDTLKQQNQALQTQADDTATKDKTAIAALNSQIDTLKGQNQALLAQENGTATKDKTAIAALNSQIDTLKGQNQALLAQANDTASKNKTAIAALNSQIDTLKGQNQALQTQANDTATKNNVATAALKAQIDNLTGQKQTQETQIGDLQSRVVDLQSANALITPVARCDALAGYSYDPDRPSSNGWAPAIKDARAAWTVCRDALPASANDPKTRRRITLQMGRAYQASGDLNSALQYWQDAANQGSSRAFSELANLYADRTNPRFFNANQAWENLKSAADINPADPTTLYYMAIAHLYPSDGTAKFTAPVPDAATGELYLQRAINADYGPAYYIAGARYWRKSKTERTKDEQNRDLTIATWYLTTSWCAKKHSDKEGNDARKFLNAADLTCQ